MAPLAASGVTWAPRGCPLLSVSSGGLLLTYVAAAGWGGWDLRKPQAHVH